MSEHSTRVYRGHDSYRRSARHSDSRSSEQELSETTKRHAIKLAICVVVFVVMFVIKLAMPSTIAKMSDRVLTIVSGDVNYKAAVSTLGEAISGEKKLSDALTEAYYYAFWISGEEDTEVSGNASVNEEDGTKTEDTNASQNSPEPD